MKYKKYFRKTSLKQKVDSNFFLNDVKNSKPKFFLEVGVFHGVTARNVCELLYKIHKHDFKFIGLDLFEKNKENKDEIIPNTSFSNPLKTIWYKYIKREDPYSLSSVKNLLSKFKDNVYLLKGNSNVILKKIDMSKIDFVFLDGGHNYETVLNDLNCCNEVVKNNGVILCDDYDLTYAPGIKKAIDKFVVENSFNCEIICNNRFAKIEKK